MRNGARLSGGARRSVDLAREVDLSYTLTEGKLRHQVAVVRAYAELPPVYCQPTLLGQVLVNLLAASRKGRRAGLFLGPRSREGREEKIGWFGGVGDSFQDRAPHADR